MCVYKLTSPSIPTDAALSSNSQNKVFVHCARGISRSATFVIAYLMKSQHWTVNEAYAFLRRKRRVMPNLGFMLCLGEWESELGLNVDGALGSESGSESE